MKNSRKSRRPKEVKVLCKFIWHSDYIQPLYSYKRVRKRRTPGGR